MLHLIHQHLIRLRPSQALYVDLYFFLSLIEKLANAEQKILFLSRCKQARILPRSIATIHLPLQRRSTISNIQLIILNKAVRESYQSAHSLRAKLRQHNFFCNNFCAPQAPQRLMAHAELFHFAYNHASTVRNKLHNNKFLWLTQRNYKNSNTASQSKNEQQQQQHQQQQQQQQQHTNISTTNNDNFVVTDLSGQLSPDEKQLLSLGPKFAIKKTPKATELQASILRLRYSIEWQKCLEQNTTSDQFMRYPHEKDVKIPPAIQDEGDRTRLSILLNELTLIAQRTCRSPPRTNLSRNEHTTLRTLRMKNLILIPSDKGGEFCSLTQEQYHNAAINHLSGSAYKKVRNIKATTVEKRINTVWKKICVEAELPKFVTQQYTATNSRHPAFYCLPKTHKTEPLLKVRPIVSCTRSPDRKVTWLLTKLLSFLISDVNSHLQSSFELIQKIQQFANHKSSKMKYPFSLDVVSLYTSIPTQEAILTVKTRLSTQGFNYNGITVDHVSRLLETILSNRLFSYDNQLYEQCSGLAMGSPLSGLLSTLVMDDLERRTLTADLAIDLYYRYVDDIFIITTDSTQAHTIFNKFNSSHPTLKFELENPINHKLALLDFQVAFNTDTPTFEFYQKAAKKNVFVHQRSALPTTQKSCIIRNEWNRITSRCTEKTAKESAKKGFIDNLKARGYSSTHIENSLERQGTIGRIQNNEENSRRHWFWFPFYNDQTDKRIKAAIKKSQFDIGIYRRNTSLRSVLKKTSTTRCPTNCNIPKCQAMNSVYWIECDCNATYCGSSKRTLHERLREHGSNTGSNSTTVSLHRLECQQLNGPIQAKVIDRGRDTIDTRLREAIYILNEKPTLNKKDELIKWIERRP